MSYEQNKRDANEDAVIAPAIEVGANVRKMCKDEGHDLIVAFRGIVYIAEVKNPSYKWTLTQLEKKRKAELEAVGVSYNILEYPEDMLRMIGLL